MAYTETTNDSTVYEWDDNPYGGVTKITVTDGAVTELIIQDSNFVNVLYTKDLTLLAHIESTIGDLLAELTP